MSLPAETHVAGYRLELEAMHDPADPERGEWVDCWVTSPCGRFTNSLALLEGEGAFDDGPSVPGSILDRIRQTAETYGY